MEGVKSPVKLAVVPAVRLRSDNPRSAELPKKSTRLQKSATPPKENLSSPDTLKLLAVSRALGTLRLRSLAAPSHLTCMFR